jgi:tRNA threonylcarbamoyl adenosine modification protein YjeE
MYFSVHSGSVGARLLASHPSSSKIGVLMDDSLALPSLDATQALALRIAKTLTRGDVVALAGELGTGKTTFVQFLVAAMKGGVEVTSPTFTLLQTYPVTLADGSACELHHYDLYRITHPRELEELGLEDAPLAVIEWPERLADPRLVTLALSFALASDGSRSVRIQRIKP